MLPEASAYFVSEDVRPVIAAEKVRPKILLADDHHLILDALRTMMGSDFDVRAVDNSQAFIEAIEEFKPDVAILDINMPGGDGFSTARRALERRPALPIVFLSMYGEPKYVDQAAQVGAKAYLSKTAPAQELISAIHAVLEGEALLSRPVVAVDETGTSQSSKGDLTARQREVLRLIALGSSAKDIANQLNISVRTAEFHRAAIMQRLGLHSTAQMTRYAITNNIG
ncbi:MAG: response regulator transcription factor [Acidobacteriota bacterium]|nr:response regulator transcription factor [Acidobacteriota bacterium]